MHDAAPRHDHGAEPRHCDRRVLGGPADEEAEQSFAGDQIEPRVGRGVRFDGARSREQQARGVGDRHGALATLGAAQHQRRSVAAQQGAVRERRIAQAHTILLGRRADQAVEPGVERDALDLAPGQHHLAEHRRAHANVVGGDADHVTLHQAALVQEHACGGRRDDRVAREVERVAVGERQLRDRHAVAHAFDGERVAEPRREHAFGLLPIGRQREQRLGAHLRGRHDDAGAGRDHRIGVLAEFAEQLLRGLVLARVQRSHDDHRLGARQRGPAGREQHPPAVFDRLVRTHARECGNDRQPMRRRAGQQLRQRVGLAVATVAAQRADCAVGDRGVGVAERAAQGAHQARIGIEVERRRDEAAQHPFLTILLLGALELQRVEDARAADLLVEHVELLLLRLDLGPRAAADLDQGSLGALAHEPPRVAEFLQQAVDAQAVFAVVAVDARDDRRERLPLLRQELADLLQARRQGLGLEARARGDQLFVGPLLLRGQRGQRAAADDQQGFHDVHRVGSVVVHGVICSDGHGPAECPAFRARRIVWRGSVRAAVDLGFQRAAVPTSRGRALSGNVPGVSPSIAPKRRFPADPPLGGAR